MSVSVCDLPETPPTPTPVLLGYRINNCNKMFLKSDVDEYWIHFAVVGDALASVR